MPNSARVSLQQTLKTDALVEGIALFAGIKTSALLKPAPEGSGIRFRRVDLPGAPEIPATTDFVVDRPRRTALQRGEATVELVEHCLSALVGLGIDNCTVDLIGPEPPAGDGSASNFVEAIRRAGIATQTAPRNPIAITEPIHIHQDDAMVVALPANSIESEYLFILDYGPNSPLGKQVHAVSLSPQAYEAEIAGARTYSTLAEATAMWNRGLFKHLTPRDMLVIGEQGPIDNAYRFENEPVRHKLLDLIGDLALVGRPLIGRVVAVRSGHALNQRLAREIAARAVAPGAPLRTIDIASLLNDLKQRFPLPLVDRVKAFLLPGVAKAPRA